MDGRGDRRPDYAGRMFTECFISAAAGRNEL
jgi:hypothetical protein